MTLHDHTYKVGDWVRVTKMRGRNPDKRWIGQTGTVGVITVGDMVLVDIDGRPSALDVAFFPDELELINGLTQAIKRLETRHEI